MNFSTIKPANSASNGVGTGQEQLVSLSQRAADQVAQSGLPEVAETNSSTALPAATANAALPNDQACLDEIYQWMVANQGRMTGDQAQAMVNELVEKLNTAKTPDGKPVYKNDTEMMASVTGLKSRCDSAGDKQDAFLDKVTGALFGRGLMMQSLMKSVFQDEVKEWYSE